MRRRAGRPVETFGKNGAVNLRVGVADKFPEANYSLTSPPAVYRDLLIMGPRTAEGPPDAKGPAGNIRAFSAITGEFVWGFHTLPRREL